MAPMTVSPFAGWLITAYDWRTAQLVIAIVAWVILVPTALAGAPGAGGAGRRWRDGTPCRAPPIPA